MLRLAAEGAVKRAFRIGARKLSHSPISLPSFEANSRPMPRDILVLGSS
ncbi:hypothetical protein SFOMI_1751 [Sphingobium fuliginis]|uniref:Uncharacterized protein n=1 Tax=Sphingobium fuliginis (strain ATCC 27551) TaxID=336203 RepID=A0A292ZED3_SPHSA|nr:hypothetical protein SFOMI_1751 [Sphingobium fuliginis]